MSQIRRYIEINKPENESICEILEMLLEEIEEIEELEERIKKLESK